MASEWQLKRGLLVKEIVENQKLKSACMSIYNDTSKEKKKTSNHTH